jgi:hypothetical protein
MGTNFEKISEHFKYCEIVRPYYNKSIIVNTFACSKIWYTGSVVAMPPAYLRQFQYDILKFLWPRAHYEP